MSQHLKYHRMWNDTKSKLGGVGPALPFCRNINKKKKLGHITCDTWPVTHKMWHMTYYMWHGEGGEHLIKSAAA